MEETILPHLEPLEPVRVIEADNARTFATHGVLLDMAPGKSTLHDYSDAVLLTNDTPIPVVGEEGRQIGWATVSRSGWKIVAAINIDYHCPERMSIEAGRKVYALPSIEHYVEDETKKPIVVEAVEVNSICLESNIRPGDLSLPAVGEPVL